MSSDLTVTNALEGNGNLGGMLSRHEILSIADTTSRLNKGIKQYGYTNNCNMKMGILS